MGAKLEPIIIICAVLAEDGNGSTMQSIPEMLPSLTGTAVWFNWKDILKHLCEQDKMEEFAHLIGVDSKPAFLFSVMQCPLQLFDLTDLNPSQHSGKFNTGLHLVCGQNQV